MKMASFSPPKQWEDWVNTALGIWLFVSPWVPQLGSDPLAAQNAGAIGFLLIATEFVELSAFQVWEEWINVVLGAWLVVSPWVLGITTALVPTVNFVAVGLVVLALSLYEIWDVRHHASGHA